MVVMIPPTLAAPEKQVVLTVGPRMWTGTAPVKGRPKVWLPKEEVRLLVVKGRIGTLPTPKLILAPNSPTT